MERNPLIHRLYKKLNQNNKLNNILKRLVGNCIDNYIISYKIEVIDLTYNSCIIKDGRIYFIYLISEDIKENTINKHRDYCNENHIPLLLTREELDEYELERKIWLFLGTMNRITVTNLITTSG